MNVSFINHFIESTANVFSTMLGTEIKRKSLELKPGCQPTHDVSAVIGLSGKVSGSVVLSMESQVALSAAGQMLFEELTEINAEVVDAVGELANMIAGGAKAEMSELALSLGLPNVIAGRDHQIFFPGNVRPITVGFVSEWGQLAIDVGFNEALEGDISTIESSEAVLA